ncbi:UPF0058 family protein [Natrinema ejinorense]|uniref:Metal-binding protein n=1 Tax=Natrinema ejinorense TaxID=373386 RepID=A0A2A5R0V6_9EURY|nr:UPF0058 family protein [Natrinema ejinorense]PCR92711.1 hypothetical protein CP557_12010 [Natrinema ejinorense]
MKSQEHIHLHALLFEVRRELEQEGAVPPGAFDTYDEQPVRPTHIHKGKEAHKSGIKLLLKGIRRSIQKHPPPENAPPT